MLLLAICAGIPASPPPIFVIAAAGCCLGCRCVVGVSFLVVLVVDVVVVLPLSYTAVVAAAV